MPRLTRKQMLAAELYGYSYANYEDHLGNIRFDRLMPGDVDTMEQAERQGWAPARVSRAIQIPEKRIEMWQRTYREAKEIVDAPTLAEAFRRGVRYSIQAAVEEGLDDTTSIERLVTQICYRAADLAFRLDMEDQRLSHYSEELRTETEYGQEYWSEVIEQELEKRLERIKRVFDQSTTRHVSSTALKRTCIPDGRALNFPPP